MTMLGLAMVQVMDEVWSVPALWLGFVLLGGAAAWLARRSIFASLCVASLVVLLAMGQLSEILDPIVTSAIRTEAGPAYFIHSYAAIALAVALCAGAVAVELLRRGRRRGTAGAAA